jgi:hypothetical protein
VVRVTAIWVSTKVELVLSTVEVLPPHLVCIKFVYWHGVPWLALRESIFAFTSNCLLEAHLTQRNSTRSCLKSDQLTDIGVLSILRPQAVFDAHPVPDLLRCVTRIWISCLRCWCCQSYRSWLGSHTRII